VDDQRIECPVECPVCHNPFPRGKTGVREYGCDSCKDQHAACLDCRRTAIPAEKKVPNENWTECPTRDKMIGWKICAGE
jgi:hypothetical protein